MTPCVPGQASATPAGRVAGTSNHMQLVAEVNDRCENWRVACPGGQEIKEGNSSSACEGKLNENHV